MIVKIVQILLLALLPTLGFSQTTKAGIVIATMPFGNNGYSFIQETGTQNFYKSSPHEKGELFVGEKVTLVFQNENKESAEILGINVQSRLYCRQIKSVSDAYISETSNDRGDRSVTSPFPFCETDSNPIGGGDGYLNIITFADVTQPQYHITSFAGADVFRDLIEGAPDGSIIYIEDGLTIDLTGLADFGLGGAIEISNTITIASGRGSLGGATIKTDDYSDFLTAGDEDGAPMFRVLSKNVRFTGIKFVGPYDGTDPIVDGADLIYRSKRAIHLEGYGTNIPANVADNLEVDNCEFSGFPYIAISIAGASGVSGSFENNRIHHNYIHHNRQDGLGYGVHIDFGYAKIYANIFESNRHDITGTGKKTSGYEAYCNTILDGGRSHNFDMHDEGEGNGSETHTQNAGKFIFIHHNDFIDIGANRYANQPTQNIVIRGRPSVQCRIENNRFNHRTDGSAIWQKNDEGGHGNMLIWNNIFEGKEYKVWYVKRKWSNTSISNYMVLTYSAPGLLTNPIGSTHTYDYTFGDYNGDKKTDVYKLEDGVLYTIPLNALVNGYNQDWLYLQDIGYPFSELRFGKYNANGKTDVIVHDGGIIYISAEGTGNWTPLLNPGYPLSTLLSGNFDGNPITDLMRADGIEWKVSYNSNSPWTHLNYSGYLTPDLRIGRFNSNLKSEIFTADGIEFLVSYEGTNLWHAINNSGYTISQMQLHDFDGDGKSDVVRNDRFVSITGLTLWIGCNTDNFPIATFPYGNF